MCIEIAEGDHIVGFAVEYGWSLVPLLTYYSANKGWQLSSPWLEAAGRAIRQS